MKTERFYASVAAIQRAHGADARTVGKWIARKDWPEKTRKGWPAVAVDKAVLAIRRAQVASTAGPDTDLRRTKLQRQIHLLEIDIRQRERGDELHRIESEAKRDLWASREQVAELCGRFSRAIDDAVDAAGMVTRSPDVVDAVKERFDGIRRELVRWMEKK